MDYKLYETIQAVLSALVQPLLIVSSNTKPAKTFCPRSWLSLPKIVDLGQILSAPLCILSLDTRAESVFKDVVQKESPLVS